jgi:GTPase SAR1 family protein
VVLFALTRLSAQFVSMRNLYMKAGEVFVVVYSIVAESTFFETKEIREQILDTKDPIVPPIVLVGNKLDLADERTVKKDSAEAQAREWDCPYLECSAKANENIEVSERASELFVLLSDMLCAQRQSFRNVCSFTLATSPTR